MQQPVIILVNPQMGENIGATARVMLNFGLENLRVVAPRDGWPNPKAESMAVHAKKILKKAKVFKTTEEAIKDLQYVYAATARNRYMVKEVVTPKKCSSEIYKKIEKGIKFGIMFGPERTGLLNEDVVLADSIVTIPVNPKFYSLNLAQSVAIISYELFQKNQKDKASKISYGKSQLASKKEILGFFEHIEEELDKKGFFKTKELKNHMVKNIRSLFLRAKLTDQEVRTLRGAVRALSEIRKKV